MYYKMLLIYLEKIKKYNWYRQYRNKVTMMSKYKYVSDIQDNLTEIVKHSKFRKIVLKLIIIIKK